MYTKTAVTITDDKGSNTPLKYGIIGSRTGKKMASKIARRGDTRKSDPMGRLSRDIEGDITIDLINENNRFHTKSDSYNLAQKQLDKLNSETSPQTDNYSERF